MHVIDTVLEPDESSIEPAAIEAALLKMDGQHNNWEAESGVNTQQSRSFHLTRCPASCTCVCINQHLKASQDVCEIAVSSTPTIAPKREYFMQKWSMRKVAQFGYFAQLQKRGACT